MQFSSRRTFSVAAAASLGAGVLFSAGVAQADVVSNAQIHTNSSAFIYAGPCTYTDSQTGTTPVDFAANGGQATNTVTQHVVSTSPNDSNDTYTQDLSDTTTAAVTSVGNSIAGIHISSTGSVKGTAALSTTECQSVAGAENDVDFDFTVTTPGYLDLTFAADGPGYGSFEIQQPAESNTDDLYAFFDIERQYQKSSSSHSVYLVPGEYHGFYLSAPFNKTSSQVLNGGVHTVQLDATFTPDGTVAPTPAAPAPVTTPAAARGVLAKPSVGKGLGYTSLPLARSCSTNTLVENVTSSKAAAKSIKKVTIFVDGAKALTVKRPKAGQALTVPVADNGTVRSVKTVVTTKKKGTKKTKKYSSSASYQDC